MRYDDPRWYEQPEKDELHNLLPNDNFSVMPPQPTRTNSVWQPVETQQNMPEDKGRGGRIFGQIVLTLALMVLAFLGGWFAHQTLTNGFFTQSGQSSKYESLFQQAWNIVDQNYVDRKAVNYQQMSYQAIQAMLDVLHDQGHTRFLTAAQVQAEKQSLSGTFVGIGVYIQQDTATKNLIIASTIPGSPAEKAGVQRGDILLSVNGQNVVGRDFNSVQPLIEGNAGTQVTIIIRRPSTGQTHTFTIMREEIQVPNVIMHYIPEDHIAHIQIVQFANGVSDQLKNAITQAKKMGARQIILDLRDNPGGYLQEAINTVSEFVGKGNVLLEQDSTGQRTPFAVSGQTVDASIPIVVLINQNTASAAEIVSGALQDNHRAILMGTKTYGTGTVLQEFDLSDGSAILLGVDEWLTPSGHFIRTDKISPTITVTLPQAANELTPNDENQGKMTLQQILKSGDTQLISAINYLQTH